MTIVYLILVFLFGISLGGYLQKKLTLRAMTLENEKMKLTKKNQFLEVLKNLKLNRTAFKSRVNDTVYISTELNDHGDVDLIYLMDKKDIAIFKDNKCLYTSDQIEVELIHEIVSFIFQAHNRSINDVVQILGFTFYREEFERTFRIKAEDLKKSAMFDNFKVDIDEIEQIKVTNSKKFDIDTILDKISAYGISSLTLEERLFLDNYSNEKRN